MLKEIRIYVEGGGDEKSSWGPFRKGFKAFLKDVDSLAQKKNIKLEVISCGDGASTLKDFRIALRDHKYAFNILLVDSEGPVKDDPPNPRAYLMEKYKNNQTLKQILKSADDEQCHLMVQAMEAWIIADRDKLKKFYGPKFNMNPIPKNRNVEQVEKAALEPSLKTATRKTKKGEYHKIQHASELLKLVDPAKVRIAAPHCKRFFLTLEQKIDQP